MSDTSKLNVEPWYKDGLRFHCTECGKCCSEVPGVVWVSEDELLAFAKRFDLSPEDFALRYMRLVGGRLALLEKTDGSFDCIFLKGKRCTVYEDRPVQCRTFPWWPQNLQSKESWEGLREECEGVNHEDAELISAEKIQEVLSEQEKYNAESF